MIGLKETLQCLSEKRMKRKLDTILEIGAELVTIAFIVIAIVASFSYAHCQSIPTIPSDSIILIGAECAASTQPKCSGFLAYAIPLTKSSDNPFYSWTKIYQAAPSNIHSPIPTAITTTGFAKDFYNHTFSSGSSIAFIGLGAIGVSNSATALTGAFNDGFGVVGKGIGSKTKLTWVRWWVGGMHVKTGGVDKIDVMISLGK